MLSREEIDIIAKKIAENFPVKEIILFGSYAKGNVHKDSDIDLCVILDEEKEKINKFEMMSNVARVLLKTGNYKGPMDILVYPVEEFYNKSKLNTAFECEIRTTGVKIYG